MVTSLVPVNNLTKEKQMSPIDYNEVGDPNEVFLPKVGEKVIVQIVSMEKIEDPEKTNPKNFRSRTENFGFHYKLNLKDGKHSILNVFALLGCFKEEDIQDGDTVEIDHSGQGKYIVTKVEESAATG